MGVYFSVGNVGQREGTRIPNRGPDKNKEGKGKLSRTVGFGNLLLNTEGGYKTKQTPIVQNNRGVLRGTANKTRGGPCPSEFRGEKLEKWGQSVVQGGSALHRKRGGGGDGPQTLRRNLEPGGGEKKASWGTEKKRKKSKQPGLSEGGVQQQEGDVSLAGER